MTGSEPRGRACAAISDKLVALHKQHYGIGPSEAKTYWIDDLVVCLLRGGFTRVEESLREGGHGNSVIAQRAQWQEVMRPLFSQVVEEETRREVRGFMSGNQQGPDMIAEVFVLGPT